METVTTAAEVRRAVDGWRRQGLTVGFVPTMGYLHRGHQSLIQRSAKDNDRTVVSIFVNPLQFGAGEDFESYPRDLQADSALCKQAGADLIFAPDVKEMYPQPLVTYVNVEKLGDTLCGASRPGHFRGVCTVVTKLFHIVDPDRSYFGQKDIQQLTILRRLAGDLSFRTEVIGCPTVRDPDGLAMSSRNSYLSPKERAMALIIHQSLESARILLEGGERSAARVINAVQGTLAVRPSVEPDYIQVVDAQTLESVDTISGDIIVAVAAYVGKTRLIDNLIYPEQ